MYFGDDICYQFNPKIEIEKTERTTEEAFKQVNFKAVVDMQQTVILACNN